MPTIGDTVGRYVIEGVLGEGGMGTVYRAHDPVLHRKVALKVVRARDADADPKTAAESTARLLREARAAAALVHPSAVAIYDVGEVDGDPFIAMELVPGETLRARIGDASVSIGERLRWLAEVARVLDAAHRKGIVHRDIKPDNVMITDDGGVKVLDFGIARRRAEGPFEAATTGAGFGTLTAKGTAIGTPLYMAPEQMLAEDVDGRADQFSWGVMAWELLVGEVPWGQPKDGVALMYLILKKDPPRVSSRVDVSPEVDEAVARALAKEPEDRFASMIELVAELEPFAASRPGEAPPASRAVVSRAERAPGARWLPLAVTFVVVAGATAGVVAKARLAVRAAHPPASASSPSPGASARGAVVITDLPINPTTPEAAAAYQAGVQALRDGAMGGAIDNLTRATRLDPSLAAAHLRLALYSLNGAVPTRSTGAFQRAVQLRGSLSPRDQELVTALEPYMNRERVDLAETERRLVALTQKRQDDAELAYLLGAVRFDSDARAMMGELERAMRLDPAFVPPLAIRAHGLAYLGDLAGARRAFEQCARLAPTSSLCASYQASLDQQDGECARITETARRVLSAEPESATMMGHLAAAMASEGRPREAVQAILAQKADKTREAARAQTRERDLAKLAILFGDFDEAEARAKALAKVVASSSNQAAHASAALLLADVYLETGREREAAKLAETFMKTRDAWVPPTNVEDYAIRDDSTLPILTVMLRGGAIDKARFSADRAAWIENWRKAASPFYYGYLWIHGFAFPTETKEEAAEALAALDRYGPIPPYRSQMTADGAIGNVYRLAGKTEEALPYLRRGARACRALLEPVSSTRASLYLGLALEQAADKDGACAAYRTVLDRWGSAPRSQTASKARSHGRALGCR